MLHQVAASVIGDHGVRHAVLEQLPRGQHALIARARFFDPHVHGDARLVRLVDRRERRAPIDGRQPTRVAVREHVDARLVDGLDEGLAVVADRFARGDIVVGDLRGRGIRHGFSLACMHPRERALHLIQCPPQVDRGRARLRELGTGGVERDARAHRDRDTVRGGRTDQRRSPDVHVADRARDIRDAGQRQPLDRVRQPRLIDDHHRAAVAGELDRAAPNSFDVHYSASLNAVRA